MSGSRSPVAALVAVLALAGSPSFAAELRDCAFESTGLVPLMDLGPGRYLGFEGGLYPGGSNEIPPAHLAAGLAAAGEVVPRDGLGRPDSLHGSVFVGVFGFSNAAMEAIPLADSITADPRRKRWVRLVNCAVPGCTADRIVNPGAPYWTKVADSLRAAGCSDAQLQVVLLKLTIAYPDQPFEEFTSLLADYGSAIVGILRSRYPNVRLVYLWSRSFAGYSGYPASRDSLNPEPWAYWTGFAVKELIGRQIENRAELDGGPSPGALPWLGWGAYLWTDGRQPRSDGLRWECTDLNPDAVHPSPKGRGKAASRWMRFFREEDPLSKVWYHSGADGAVPESAPPDPGEWLEGTLYPVTGRAPRGAALRVRRDALLHGSILRRGDIAPGMYWLRAPGPAAAPPRRILVVR